MKAIFGYFGGAFMTGQEEFSERNGIYLTEMPLQMSEYHTNWKKSLCIRNTTS